MQSRFDQESARLKDLLSNRINDVQQEMLGVERELERVRKIAEAVKPMELSPLHRNQQTASLSPQRDTQKKTP